MSSGERPIGAAKGKQPDTKAPCHPPPHLPIFMVDPPPPFYGGGGGWNRQNHLEERLLDQAQARASKTPLFGGSFT